MTPTQAACPVVLLLVLMSTACEKVTSPQERLLPPLPLPVTDRVIFESDRVDTLGDIFAVTLDGSDVRPLAASPLGEWCPSISPDGNWIAYYVGPHHEGSYSLVSKLAVMRANGTESRGIADIGVPRGCPLWARQSDQFAVTVWMETPTGSTASHLRTQVFDLSGAERSRVEYYNLSIASFSADGHEFMGVWADCGKNGCTAPDIFVSPLNGYPTRYLTGVASPAFQHEGGTSPSLSPDGSIVVYVCADGFGGLPNSICTVRWDDTGKVRLIGNALSDPVFSPNGQKIAFRCGQPFGAVCVMNGDGSGVTSTPIQTVGGYPTWTDWTPDGTGVLASCGTDICLVRLEASEVRNLTSGKGVNVTPSIARTWLMPN